MKQQRGNAMVGAIFFLIYALGIVGWVANIVKLVTTTPEIVQWGAMEILRVVGIFIAPLGAVLGYF